MKDIIIDTDPGVDDALAIMLAVKSGNFRIHAITTVAGNSTIDDTTRNARFILKLLGREDIPVYSGAKNPLKRKLDRAVVHGKDGLGGLKPLNGPGLSGDAVERISSIIERNSGKITIVALGPLTNIARMIEDYPQTIPKMKSVVMMGGAIRVPGNKSRVAEFNMYVDPEAADIVFRSPVMKTMLPLDACDVQLSLTDFEKIRDAELRSPILEMVVPYMRNLSKNEGTSKAMMYDPLTVYSLMNPSACRKRRINAVVETRGEFTRGMTVAEQRRWKEENPNVTVVEKVSARRFKADFVRILSKAPP